MYHNSGREVNTAGLVDMSSGARKTAESRTRTIWSRLGKVRIFSLSWKESPKQHPIKP